MSLSTEYNFLSSIGISGGRFWMTEAFTTSPGFEPFRIELIRFRLYMKIVPNDKIILNPVGTVQLEAVSEATSALCCQNVPFPCCMGQTRLRSFYGCSYMFQLSWR